MNNLKISCLDGDFVEYGTFPDKEVQLDHGRPSTSTSTPVDVNNLATTPGSPQLPPLK